jgi:hypothetical protein
MSEGFADYWAASYFFETKKANTLNPFCFGEWVKRSTGGTGCTRTLDESSTIKAFSQSGLDHDNAIVWTAALLAMRSAFTQAMADAIILRSHRSVPDGPSFIEGVRAIFTADEALRKNGLTHSAALCKIFVDRQIITESDCKPLP